MLYIKITWQRLFSEIHSEVNFPYSKAVGQLTRGNMKKLFLAFLVCASCESTKSVEDVGVSVVPSSSVNADDSVVDSVADSVADVASDVAYCAVDASVSDDSVKQDAVKDSVNAEVK